jgi:hypothetical protein
LSTWTIKYRATDGIAHASVAANTLEEAEKFFNDFLVKNAMFGVVIKVTPDAPEDYVPAI